MLLDPNFVLTIVASLVFVVAGLVVVCRGGGVR